MMKKGDGRASTTASNWNRWILIFLGIVVLGLVAVGLISMKNTLDFYVSASPGTAGHGDAPTESVAEPSVQLGSAAGDKSVQSVQWKPSAGSYQAIFGGAGVMIADIGMLDLADLKINEDLPGEWRNILLLGTDSRDMETLSLFDTIIIASVHKSTGELKLTSILRDTVVPIAGRGMQRINTTAFYGGPSLLMQAINMNFGLNISDYVLVNFAGLAKAVDSLGGITLDIDEKEMREINRSMGTIAQYTMRKEDYLAKREEMKIKAPGKGILVNGIQAVSYARIRKIDSDAARVGRQRLVISRIAERVRAAGTGQLLSTAIGMWGDVTTNISMMDAISLAKGVLRADGARTVPELTIPNANAMRTSDGALIEVDLTANALEMLSFIYGSLNP